MDTVFKCGMIQVAPPGVEPNWTDFCNRIAFTQKMGFNATFLTSFTNEAGECIVPFFSAEDAEGRLANAREVISCATPYKLVGLKTIDLTQADIETLQCLSKLVPEPAREVRPSDVMPCGIHHAINRVEDAFEGLVGMEEQKSLFTRLALARSKFGPNAIGSFHFVFDGEPGTGKTELASRAPAILDFLGITDGSGRYIKVGEADIVSKYVGHTAPNMRRIVESALGATLHIDEFYSIANAHSFGQEAVDTLVDQLDAHKNDLVCIVSGYPEEIDRVLDLNQGLRDRFTFRITFPAYSIDELAEIFETMAAKRGFRTKNHQAVIDCAARLTHSRGFSNARTMRKLLDHTIIEAASAHDEATITERDLMGALKQIVDDTGPRPIGF